ncbi:hypothetical protein ACFSYD_22645 [Paracoccus aerius]
MIFSTEWLRSLGGFDEALDTGPRFRAAATWTSCSAWFGRASRSPTRPGRRSITNTAATSRGCAGSSGPGVCRWARCRARTGASIPKRPRRIVVSWHGFWSGVTDRCLRDILWDAPRFLRGWSWPSLAASSRGWPGNTTVHGIALPFVVRNMADETPAPWAILHIDLEQLPKRLEAPAGARGVVLYFRLRGMVLGLAHELPNAFPMARGDLARRAALATGDTVALLLGSGLRPIPPCEAGRYWTLSPVPDATSLDRLARLITARRAVTSNLEASIVICTRRRAADLDGCLASLLGKSRKVAILSLSTTVPTPRPRPSRAGIRASAMSRNRGRG